MDLLFPQKMNQNAVDPMEQAGSSTRREKDECHCCAQTKKRHIH